MKRHSEVVGFSVCLAVVSIVLSLSAVGCSRNPTTVAREAAARPRVEQLALATAMREAYRSVDFSLVENKKVFVETKALAKTDIDFITSYVQEQVLAAGGSPVLAQDHAQVRLTSTVEVSGTDEVQKIGKDVVMGQFVGSLSVVDLASGSIVRMFELDSMTQTKRNRKAKTKIVN